MNDDKQNDINRQSSTRKYLKDRKKINLVGSIFGVESPYQKCPKCDAGRFSNRQQNEAGDWYLICNNFPICKHTQKSSAIISAKQAQDIEFTHPQDGASGGVGQKEPLVCYSFGSRGKNRKGLGNKLDDDLNSLFGGNATLVDSRTMTYSDGQWSES